MNKNAMWSQPTLQNEDIVFVNTRTGVAEQTYASPARLRKKAHNENNNNRFNQPRESYVAALGSPTRNRTDDSLIGF